MKSQCRTEGKSLWITGTLMLSRSPQPAEHLFERRNVVPEGTSVLYREERGIAWITLNRLDVRNAMDEAPAPTARARPRCCQGR